ncbi:GNAT family N-acetyltransferase [Streptomyces violascens]|uniref:GNAT family N-acetyltransferase n=1 Tax=Streptomyces violascens TaxID=67381 RepID=UPI0036C2F3B7
MPFSWDWLEPVVQVPYVPTLGPVHPTALGPNLFADILAVAGTGRFLPYDKDQRWAAQKDESVLADAVVHTREHTLIPTLAHRGQGQVTVYAYGMVRDAAELAAKLAVAHQAATARVVIFQPPDELPPAGSSATRIQLREFEGTRRQDQPARVQAVADLPEPVRETFTAFTNRLACDGFAFLYQQMQRGAVGPVLTVVGGGRVVGAIGPMETMVDSAGATRLLPQYFGVLPEHRGHGHGRTLWRAAMAWGTFHGADYQLLQTETGGASDRLCQAEGLASLGFVTTTKL